MMRRNRRNRQQGSVMVEFALAGTVAITMLITTVQLSIGLWHYHMLAYAVHEATRYASVHGRGCVTGTASCGITVGNIVARIKTDSVGMPDNALNVTLTTDSGAVTTCNPITSCSSNSTRWPPTSNLDNATGKRVVITASYTFNHNMVIIWPGSFTQHFSNFVLPASSTETIVF
jgi:Flp pilus assembly protein TadG